MNRYATGQIAFFYLPAQLAALHFRRVEVLEIRLTRFVLPLDLLLEVIGLTQPVEACRISRAILRAHRGHMAKEAVAVGFRARQTIQTARHRIGRIDQKGDGIDVWGHVFDWRDLIADHSPAACQLGDEHVCQPRDDQSIADVFGNKPLAKMRELRLVFHLAPQRQRITGVIDRMRGNFAVRSFAGCPVAFACDAFLVFFELFHQPNPAQAFTRKSGKKFDMVARRRLLGAFPAIVHVIRFGQCHR